MDILTPQTFLLLALGIGAGLAIAVGANLLMKTKTAKKVEVNVEDEMAAAAEKAIEWLSDTAPEQKAKEEADASIAAKRSRLAKVAATLQAKAATQPPRAPQ
jgi:hypothetical protein